MPVRVSIGMIPATTRANAGEGSEPGSVRMAKIPYCVNDRLSSSAAATSRQSHPITRVGALRTIARPATT